MALGEKYEWYRPTNLLSAMINSDSTNRYTQHDKQARTIDFCVLLPEYTYATQHLPMSLFCAAVLSYAVVVQFNYNAILQHN